MSGIRRSSKRPPPATVRDFKELARRIDRAEAPTIKAEGRAIFQHHERLRAILQSLRTERRRQGLSLTELAERTGIAKPNLSRLERSNTTPTLETLERYAHALGKAVRLELVEADA